MLRVVRGVGGRVGPSRLPLERSSLRDDCAAVLGTGVAPPNSLRSLRSLRSDSRGESVHEARSRAPTPALRSSPRPREPPPRTAHHEAPKRSATPRFGIRSTRIRHTPTAALLAYDRCLCTPPSSPARARAGGGGCAWGGAEARRACGRARSAHRQLTRGRCPSAANAVSEASSATGPQDRAPQGSRRAAATADVARPSPPARARAAPTSARQPTR